MVIESGNVWFITEFADRIIKILDLTSGKLKISLNGDITSVREFVFSRRHLYLFSCGEDQQVKLEELWSFISCIFHGIRS